MLLLVPQGVLAFAFVTGGGGVVFLLGYVAALAFAPTVLALALWLLRSVQGWRRSRHGESTDLVSPGTPGSRAACHALAWANAVVAAALLVVAVADVLDPVRTWSAIACAASNVWVALYYRSARRWDGRAVPGAALRPDSDG